MQNSFEMSELGQFTGSGQVFKYWCSQKIVYTEGVQYLAKNAGCYWLLDEIALLILPRLLKYHKDVFYYIQLLVNDDCSAVITVEDGNENVHFKHKIGWTDFPVIGEPVKFFLCCSGDHYCLMLPSEY